MKKINLHSKKTLIVSILLLAAVIGVAATVALGVARSNSVTNTFKAGKIDTEIDEEIDVDGTTLKKSVSVKNSDSATSDAYVRVRLTKSPENEEITLKFADGAISTPINEASDTWIYNEKDGFYYYRYSVEPGKATTELLSSVDPGSYTGEFDVTAYQESCIATEENPYVENGDNSPLELTVLTSAFENATTTTE